MAHELACVRVAVKMLHCHSAPPQANFAGFPFVFPSMSKTDHDSDSDVSELDAKELSQALSTDQWAPMLGYCEDPETPLTADTFPSKSGGKPVSPRSFNPTQPNRRLLKRVLS